MVTTFKKRHGSSPPLLSRGVWIPHALKMAQTIAPCLFMLGLIQYSFVFWCIVNRHEAGRKVDYFLVYAETESCWLLII